MAAPTRIFTLNIGMQTVGLAEFRTNSAGGLVLQNFRLTELLADPAAEASRVAQMRITVKEMAGAMHIKAGTVNYAIPAQSVFTRFVKLPSVDPDQVDQMITFEAQQNVPFPIEEVVWDYQLVGGAEDTSKMEVVLVAIKSDMLEDINGAVEDSGLSTGVVDVAPMALYNAFRYNYSEMGGCTLLIDIGARTTNLIFIEPNKVFSRSIPIGGTTITGAIAKDFNEAFGAAEERKRSVGFVSLGGSYAEPSDPDVARVSKMIRNTMTRLHSEITRSISFYRSQQGGSQPTRAFLCGGSTALPYMREFFSEKLQMPIEFFNPLRNVSVGPGVDADHAGRSAHVLGELVGLSLRSISECPMELNLRPASVEKKQTLAAKQPYLVLAGICLLLSVAGMWLYYSKATAIETQVSEKLDAQIGPLKAVQSQFDGAKKEIQSAQATAAPFVEAIDERDFWVRILDDINARLPQQNIWVTLFETATFGEPSASPAPGADGAAPEPPRPKPAGSPAKPQTGVRVKGLYLNDPAVVDQFMKNLQQSPYVASVTIPPGGRVSPNDATWAFDYELDVALKRNIAPQPVPEGGAPAEGAAAEGAAPAENTNPDNAAPQ